MTTKYTQHVGNKKTPQSEPIPGTKQVKNSAGGFSFPVDDWVRLDRFLILGTEGGSYYASERKLTKQSAEAAERCIKADGLRVIARVVEISDQNRAPKNDPAILVLAMAAKVGDEATRKAAYEALPKVCRIGTHLMHFAEYVQAFGGWGRGTRNAVGKWYNQKPGAKLAYQLIKYQSRDKWSNRDLLRLSHPKAASPEHNALYHWVVKGELPKELPEVKNGHGPTGLAIVQAFEAAKVAKDVKEIVGLIKEFKLPREAIPTQFLTEKKVWEALLPDMGLTAMIRNLANMTRAGVITPMGKDTQFIYDKIMDEEELKKGRIHPIALLTAMMTYSAGRGMRGTNTWTPVQKINDALDGAFYKAFKTVEPTGKRTLLALDISGSMDGGEVAGVPGLSPRIASAAMALITAAVEKNHHFIAFTCGSGGYYGSRGGNGVSGIRQVNITPRDRLDTTVAKSQALAQYMGGTDCALPMLWADRNKVEVDTFVVYTDSETWAGDIHPVQALRSYRQKTGIPAKLVVVGMVANEFTIADPTDAGMMDVVGFDTNAPSLISDFSRG